MFLALHPIELNIYQLAQFARASRHVADFNLKRLLDVIKEWDTTWISCDSLRAWL